MGLNSTLPPYYHHAVFCDVVLASLHLFELYIICCILLYTSLPVICVSRLLLLMMTVVRLMLTLQLHASAVLSCPLQAYKETVRTAKYTCCGFWAGCGLDAPKPVNCRRCSVLCFTVALSSSCVCSAARYAILHIAIMEAVPATIRSVVVPRMLTCSTV